MPVDIIPFACHRLGKHPDFSAAFNCNVFAATTRIVGTVLFRQIVYGIVVVDEAVVL
jgi:hypothetical protein